MPTLPGFHLTPGFKPDYKNRVPACKFPPKVQPGSLILNLNRFNLLRRNSAAAPEISQIEPRTLLNPALSRSNAVRHWTSASAAAAAAVLEGRMITARSQSSLVESTPTHGGTREEWHVE